MSLTRSKYNKTNYDELLMQSTKPLRHLIYNPQGYNCDACHQINGQRNNRIRTTSEVSSYEYSNQIDIDNLLSNRTIPLSKSLLIDGLTDRDKKLYNIKLPDYIDCGDKSDTLYSRLTHPKENYKGMAIDRFEYPIVNENIRNLNDRLGDNTRLYMKDTYESYYSGGGKYKNKPILVNPNFAK